MKHSILTRAVSFFLTLSLVIQLFPMQRLPAFAEETEVSFSETDMSVVGEVVARREVDTKHFRMSDGSFIAVAYGTPVHYQAADGSWEDIDNTVVRDADSGGYLLNRPDVQISIPEDLSQGTVLESSMEDVSISMSLLDTDGALRLTADREVQSQELTAVPGIGVPELSPVEKITYDREAQLNILEETVPLALQDDREDALEAAIEPRTLHSAWTYEEAFPDVDLCYTAYGNSIKEEILVKEPQAAYRYDFLLTLEGLAPVHNTDGSVSLVDKVGTARYEIPVPMMKDAEGAVSYDVTYAVRDTAQGAILTVIADPEWINDEDRSFPVSIDPTLGIENQLPYDCIHSNYVMRAAPNSATAGRSEVLVGGNSSNDKFRLFLYFEGLPDIPDGCEVVDACLRMVTCDFTYTGMTQFPLGVYEVTAQMPGTFASYKAWLESFTWNTQPSYDTDAVIDCQVVPWKLGWHTWDLTRLVKQWYASMAAGNNPATIIAMTMMNEGELKANTNFATAHFMAYDALGGNSGPKFIVKYRSTTGIEPYYTYETLGAGAAGTAYISHATGQLKAAKDLISYASTTNPYSFGLVYNSDPFNAEASASHVPPTELGLNMDLGLGWTLSCIQKVCKGSAPANYLEYHDGDGTVHYFKKSGNYYYDEDGLGLKLQAKSNNNYIITDQQGNKWTFTNCFLTDLEDDDGNKILIDITNDKITSIRQENVEKDPITIATFAYNDQNQLTTVTDAANNAYNLTYTEGKLTLITRDATAVARYAYSDNRLTKLQDEESQYCLEFGYGTDGRVISWQEKAGCDSGETWADNATGANAAITYDGNSRTTYRDAGKDRVQGNTDDILTSYLFDEARRTVNAYTTDENNNILGASNAVYHNLETSSKTNNKTHQTSSIGVAARQLLKNSGFEAAATDTSWTGNTVDTTKSRTGQQAWKGSLTGGSKSVSQTVSGLTEGKEYTFSAYVNTAGVTFPNASAKIWLSGGDKQSEAIQYKTADGTGAEDMEWVRLSVTFEANAGNNTLSLNTSGCTGTLYADDFQLEEGSAPSRHNLVENGGMELVTTVNEETNIVAWTGSGGEAIADSSMGAANTGRSLKLLGDPEENVCAYQDIPIDLPSSHTYVLSGWACTNGCADNKDLKTDLAQDMHKQCGLRAVVYYENDNESATEDIEYFYVPFEPQVREQWQFASVAVVPKQADRAVEKIRVVCAFEKNANTCWYDNISLVREASQTMAYDADGNLKSVTTSGLSVDKSTYSNGNLIKTVTGGYGTFEYTYDTTHKHRLISVTNGKIQQDMAYDSFGNVTGTTLAQEEGAGKTLQTSAAYDTSGNRLASVTDASGATVTYTYGETDSDTAMNGLPVTVTSPSGSVTTNTYDVFSRMTETSIEDGADLLYNYSNGNLAAVTRWKLDRTNSNSENSNQIYSFTYNAFGDMTSASVGNIELASYAYNVTTGLLDQQKYGNDDTLTFTYDDLGRMETATYDDGTVLTYHYNGEGTLHSVTEGRIEEDDELVVARTYLYQYDTLGRLLSCQRLDGDASVIRTWQHFNEHNQVDTVAWQTGSGSYSETYEYDEEDGSLTTVTGSDGNVQSLTYDTLSRLTQRALTKDSNAILTESYIYRDIDETKTTTQVQQKAIQGGSSGYTFAYTYDTSGNILTETATKGTTVTTTTYTYDDQNQLIRENNQTAGKTWVWTYDTVGNILSRKEYAYTTGTLGAVLDTVNYGYANTQWQDLLTNYDGSPITYDAIGNPLSDESRTYTWENGRQLASLNQNGTQVTYTYDGSGLRTGKTVGTGSATQSYSYIYNGDKLVEMTANGGTLRFTYDTNGHPTTVVYNNATYYYVTNLQGDVIAILDSNRNSVVEYTYNAWGQVMSVTGSMATTLGQQNPLRYRGYVYDTETAMYYLQSRYYDPEMGRFLNSDGMMSTGQGILGYNMFAYCNNNPINHYDSAGEDPVLIAAAAGGVAGAAVGLFHYLSFSGESATLGGALLATTGGMLSGALGGAAGVLSGTAQIIAVFSSGLVAGLFADATGGDFALSALLGFAGAVGGTLIDISMYQGMDLFFANLIASLGVGFPTEMTSQSLYRDYNVYQESKQNNNTNEAETMRSTVGASRQTMPHHRGMLITMELK